MTTICQEASEQLIVKLTLFPLKVNFKILTS